MCSRPRNPRCRADQHPPAVAIRSPQYMEVARINAQHIDSVSHFEPRPALHHRHSEERAVQARQEPGDDDAADDSSDVHGETGHRLLRRAFASRCLR